DLLWYPVEGEPTIRAAPDIMVVFGRRKGYRGSYQQWKEGNVSPHGAFEIRSPGNTDEELENKRQFYERYGVDEYYLYDPETGQVFGWIRVGNKLQATKQMDGWESPRLGIRFDLSSGELVIYRPDGKRFLTFVELGQLQARTELRAKEEQRDKEKAQQ